MWYRAMRTRLAQYNQGSGVVAPLPDQRHPQQPMQADGINGPNDESAESKNSNDPYAVGRTRAIDTADKALKDPQLDYFSTPLERKLEDLHHEDINAESMASMEDGEVTYKGQNSQTIHNFYEGSNNKNNPAILHTI